MSIVIDVCALKKSYGTRPALNGISFQVEKGEVFGLLGPNGAGKTTTIRLLNGILAPTEGSVRVMGMDPIEKGGAVRRFSGVLTETPALYERLTAHQNLRFFGSLANMPQDDLESQIGELLKFFDLTSRADEKVGGFSKGMKQRLALARALLHHPALLYLDEPTSGMDPEASEQVLDLITRISRQDGRTVFLCTHNLNEAEKLCDRVGVINRGEFLAVGSLADLAANLWPGVTVEIELWQPPEPPVLQALAGFRAAQEATWQGLIATIKLDEHAAIPQLVSTLVSSGASILRVSPRQYTLKDIYFQLQNNARGGEM